MLKALASKHKLLFFLSWHMDKAVPCPIHLLHQIRMVIINQDYLPYLLHHASYTLTSRHTPPFDWTALTGRQHCHGARVHAGQRNAAARQQNGGYRAQRRHLPLTGHQTRQADFDQVKPTRAPAASHRNAGLCHVPWGAKQPPLFLQGHKKSDLDGRFFIASSAYLTRTKPQYLPQPLVHLPMPSRPTRPPPPGTGHSS